MKKQVRERLQRAEGRYERWGLAREVKSWGYHLPDAAKLEEALFKEESIEWNRIGAFQDVSMRLIAEQLDKSCAVFKADPYSASPSSYESLMRRPSLCTLHSRLHCCRQQTLDRFSAGQPSPHTISPRRRQPSLQRSFAARRPSLGMSPTPANTYSGAADSVATELAGQELGGVGRAGRLVRCLRLKSISWRTCGSHLGARTHESDHVGRSWRPATMGAQHGISALGLSHASAPVSPQRAMNWAVVGAQHEAAAASRWLRRRSGRESSPTRSAPAAVYAAAVYVQGELKQKKVVLRSPSSRGMYAFHVFCSPHNPGALELMREASEALQIEILTTDDASDITQCERMLICELTGLDARTSGFYACLYACAHACAQLCCMRCIRATAGLDAGTCGV